VILNYPSANFVDGELVGDVDKTINFLLKDIEVCAAGVLQYLVHAAEVIASRKVKTIFEDVGLTPQQALKGAMKLMTVLVEESGGMREKVTHKSGKFCLDSKPDGVFLTQARAEDAAETKLKDIHKQMGIGVVNILPGTHCRDVKAFLKKGWWKIYIGKDPACDTITTDNVHVDMTVRSMEVMENETTKVYENPDWDRILCAVRSEEFLNIKLYVEHGSRVMIKGFVNFCFASKPTKTRGTKELEILKLREILKCNLAMVYLISSTPGDISETRKKRSEEMLAEWLLKDVIGTIQLENLNDKKLQQRVEALKDFYLVFVGMPLELEDK